ncbi:amidoligase family protein [Oscillospiraceae bacterium OttesenSCG-928-G22]|nr:amidoligase family protein [Oscillospiraceae bacterium OttesenSCG-928-G22]
MRSQRWGLELEFTGITRYEAAEVLAKYLNSSVRHRGGSYDKYVVADNIGRDWTLMSDASINEQKKIHGEVQSADRNYAVELVTPICHYDDIQPLQEMVRQLRKAGAFVNSSCGIHVHVDGAGHTPRSIRNIINIVASKNDMLYKSLEINSGRMNYCKALDSALIDRFNRYQPQTMQAVSDIWYSEYSESRTSHYHDSRYHLLNLHSFFNGNGTIELRGFNATMHAGKIKTYIQLSLAMCHQAKIQRTASRIVTQSDNPKYTFRTYLLRLGLIGDEFKTARHHLLEPLPGNIAWRDPAQAERQKERQRAAREAKLAKEMAEREAEVVDSQTSDADVTETEFPEPDMVVGMELTTGGM